MLPSKQQDHGKYVHNKLSKGRQEQKPPSSHEDDAQKKLMHRDLERRRRHEMATLYASLRGLLPLEFIKGKRSVSDHMNQAVKYIKHQQNKIKEFSAKRDKLKRLSNYLNVADPEIRASSSVAAADPPIIVSVHQCLGGHEIVLAKSIKEQKLPLSRILDMLLQDNLTVVKCVFTKVQQRLIYTIHFQVPDPTGFEPSALQRKLSEAISSSSSNSSF